MRVLELVNYSISNKMTHIPSALSMIHYLEILIKNNIVKKTWNICIDKVFGSSAYYIIFNEYWEYKAEPQPLITGEIPFIDYATNSLGNALGVASGINLANKKKTWVNASDSIFQIGHVIEAIQFIGARQQDILLTVDCNNIQLTGNSLDIINMSIKNIKDILDSFSWSVLLFNPYKDDVNSIKEFMKKTGPKSILFQTIKGYGVREMMEDPVKYHYKNITSIEDITICEEL